MELTDQEVLDSTRAFWEAKCNKHNQMYEYGKYSFEEFVTNMSRMGWDPQVVEELVLEDA